MQLRQCDQIHFQLQGGCEENIMCYCSKMWKNKIMIFELEMLGIAVVNTISGYDAF